MVAVAAANKYTYVELNTQLTDITDAEWLATSVGQFPTQANLQTAAAALTAEATTFAAGTALLDMGERVYWGVDGAESEQIVFALVMNPSLTSDRTAYFVCVKDSTGTVPGGVDVVRGAF